MYLQVQIPILIHGSTTEMFSHNFGLTALKEIVSWQIMHKQWNW